MCVLFNIAIPLLGIQVYSIEILIHVYTELSTSYLPKYYSRKIGNTAITMNNSQYLLYKAFSGSVLFQALYTNGLNPP